ncbi:SsgA family sporulation/cell division regulator [Streptomyces diacarni]|uniref:SsgA family sporulation/cell division regulator n=1 Tax=Streptomyces diacarni TaxID=2800381 RepID=UPI0033F4ED80
MADTGDRPTDSTISGGEPPSNSCTTGEWQVSLVLSDTWAAPLPARFTYRADDPYAVRLDFYLAMAKPVHWTFARELLIAGRLRSVGQGDVRAWPTWGDKVCLCLNTHDGEALLEIPDAPLSKWLERTYQLVLPGREHEHQSFDADALLRHLSAEGSPGGAAPGGRETHGHPHQEPTDTTRPHTDTTDGPGGDGHGGPR